MEFFLGGEGGGGNVNRATLHQLDKMYTLQSNGRRYDKAVAR